MKRRYDEDKLSTIIACVLAVVIPVVCIVSLIAIVITDFTVLPHIISRDVTGGQLKWFICWRIAFYSSAGIILLALNKPKDDK